LFNENLIPHLKAEQRNLTLLNPARIAAPHFVSALYKPFDKKLSNSTKKNQNENWKKYKNSLILKLLLAFFILLLGSIFFFHFYENLTWIDSVYFVAVTVSTVGYGDISLAHSSTKSKFFGVLLIISSMFFIWIIFSLTIDQLLKKRIRLALGRRKYNYNNHVVVCGLGRLGYFIVELLLQKKEKVIIIEQNEECRHADYFRQLGAEVYIGDARLAKVLTDVNVTEAKALISVVNNDSVNLEIGLNARTYHPDMRLILRIFDEQMAEKIKEFLNIHLTLSASAIADDKFYRVLKNEV
jgi:voltage-gated potassium channel Kch